MKRRRFIKNIARYMAMSVAGAFPYFLSFLLAPNVKATPQTRLPLPGALADIDEFNQACIRCGVCGEVCPVQCIQFHDYEGRHSLNTPYINPEDKGCILCGKCMEACPTDALSATPITEIKMGIAQIDRAACYPWVDKGVCGACVSVCPFKAEPLNSSLQISTDPLYKRIVSVAGNA